MNYENNSSPHSVKGQRWKTFSTLLVQNLLFEPGAYSWRKVLYFCVFLLIALFLIAILINGFAHVRENQVGVAVHNISGDLVLKERVGYHFFLPYLVSFHVLDKTIQKIDLAWAGGGNQSRDIRLKTVDGSDVSLDVTINFKIIPQNAVTLLRQSGQGSRFADLWIQSYARHVSLKIFGELTTEGMYNATLRSQKARECLIEMNESLGSQGIEVISFIPGEIRFYREYESVIQEKKLADQEVEEQQAQARAASQDQYRQLVEAQTKAEIRIAAFEGESKNRIIDAQAQVQRVQSEANQQYNTTLMAAEASLYSASAEASGLRERMASEAIGMERMREALSGPGGINLIGLEYAKRMRETQFSGTPLTRDPHVQQFNLQSSQEGANAIRGLPSMPRQTFSPAENSTGEPR